VVARRAPWRGSLVGRGGHRRRHDGGRRRRALAFLDLLLEQAEVLHVLEERLVRGEDFGRLDVLLELLHVALELGAPILEPRDHLRVAQAELRGDLVAVGRRQVLLVQEPLLQLEDLVVGEGGARLALLLCVLLPRVEQVQVARLRV